MHRPHQPHGKRKKEHGYDFEHSFEKHRRRVHFKCKRLGDINEHPFCKAKRKLGIYKKTHYIEDATIRYSLDDILRLNTAYLDGYWQDFALYYSILSELRTDFCFQQPLNGKNKKLYNLLFASDSVHQPVFVHVRRGDYLKLGIYAFPGITYYDAAMRYFRRNLKKPVFYFFSDDITWCKNNFSDKANVFVDWNKDGDSYIDMQLMSLFSYGIVANSSFSIWGAMLNPNMKTVIRPHSYYKKDLSKQSYYWPESWIDIESEESIYD